MKETIKVRWYCGELNGSDECHHWMIANEFLVYWQAGECFVFCSVCGSRLDQQHAELLYAIDEIYEYLGYFNSEAFCKVRVFYGLNDIVIIEELRENTGTSITNMIEVLATQLLDKYNLSCGSVTWLEYYGYCTGDIGESWSIVTFDWDGVQYKHPQWKHIDYKDAKKILDIEGYELEVYCDA